MPLLVLFRLGDKMIAIPFRKTRCWKSLDRSKIIIGASELPEGCEPCWETYCSVRLEGCDLRKRNARLLDVNLSGYLVPEEDESPIDFPSLFPGAEGQLIKRIVFPPREKMPRKCTLYPKIISGPAEYLLIINFSGLTRCRDVAARRGLSCRSCKAA